MAGAIFAAGAAAVISATATYANVMEHERKLTSAWRVLQGDASRLRSLDDSAAEWRHDSSVGYDAFGAPVVLGAVFTVDRKVEVDVPHRGARRVTLTARWQERAGARSTTLVVHR